MSTTISILGTCDSRDIFGLHENDGGYKINRFIQSNNPISVTSADVLQKEVKGQQDFESEGIFGNISNFDKRCLTLEWMRTTFDYLAEVRSDWLIIDSGPLRYDLLRFDNCGNAYIAEVNKYINKKLTEKGFISPDAVKMPLSEMSDAEFEEHMEKYACAVSELYDEKRIIINEFYPVAFTTDGEWINCFDYEEVSIRAQNIKRGFSFFVKRFPNAHVIEFPRGVIGYSRHRWGRSPLHYVPEYYDYALEAVNIITEGSFSRNEEQAGLLKIKKCCEENLRQKYEPLLVKNINWLKYRNEYGTRMAKYEAYFKDFAKDTDKTDEIREFFRRNNFDHCAFYGITEISSFYAEKFPDWGISVDYFVEETESLLINKVPVVKRSVPEYPDTQVMIIADIMNTDKIREKLKKGNAAYPVYDVYEIAGMAGSKQ